jgi:hypothetical protein
MATGEFSTVMTSRLFMMPTSLQNSQKIDPELFYR